MPILVFKSSATPETIQVRGALWRQKLHAATKGHVLRMDSAQNPVISIDDCVAKITEDVKTSPEKEFKIYLQAVSGPVFSSTVPLQIVTYSKNLNTLVDSPTADNRVITLCHVLKEAGEIDIFMTTEYYFNWQEKTAIPFTSAERDKLLERLKEASLASPKTLFIPGTIVWKNERNECYNSAYVLLNGEYVASTDGRTRYDKAGIDYEQSFVPLTGTGMRWVGGATPRYDFQYKGLNCRLEICRDSGTPNKDQPNLQLIVSSKLGHPANAETLPGGWCVQADGDGFGLRQQPGRQNKHQESSVQITHAIEVGIPQA